MRHSTFAFALLGLFVSASLPALAPEAESSRPLHIIFDGSNSMWGELPDTSCKFEVAKDVFRGLDASLFRNRDIALRIYGHRRAGDCSDSELAVPFGTAEGALSTMADRIDGASNGRFVFEGGAYTLQAGVPTVNGVLYEPVTQEVQVAATGRTRIVVTVPRPRS